VLSLLLVASAALPVQGAADDAGSYTVRAPHVRMLGGEVLKDAEIVVEGGKIRRVGPASKDGGGHAFAHDGWISAGLVAARSYSGTRGETLEAKRSVTAEARVADVIDFGHPDFRRALESGVTTVVIAPSTGNVAAGTTAVVKTHGRNVLSREGHIVLSFGTSALRFNRAPTSIAGAIAELEGRLSRPTGVWERVAERELPVMIDAGSRDELLRAIEFAMDHRFEGALTRATLAGEVAGEVKRSGLSAIVGPFAAGTPQRSLDSVVALASQNVPIAFAIDAPSNAEDSLRMSAALCVRAGLDPAVAWNSLTATAAIVAGVGDRVGKLAPGLDADFVLWSGDPLSLSSRVVAVYVGGELAYRDGDAGPTKPKSKSKASREGGPR
jgi:imidazolonepropionase-like amidohydrolase